MDVDDNDLTDAEILEKYPVTFLGPTWRRGPDGVFEVPEFTLGWGVAAWAAKYLNPLGEYQEVFTFTNEQFRFVLWFYAVDRDGNWIYREAILQRIKGWGKDPLIAVLCLVEAFGPSRFSHFKNGVPVGKRCFPEAWVQVFALSKEQTTNTAGMFPILISDRLKKDAGLKMGVEIIRGFGGSAKIEIKTASWRSAEGGRPTFLIANETQHWLASNGGHDLAETARNNASKRGRAIAITNAPEPGEESVAEKDREGFFGSLEGRLFDRHVMYDSVEAPDHTPINDERVFKLLYEVVRGDSVWCDPDNAWLRVTDTAMKPAKARRMYLNQMWQPEGSLYTPDEWAAIASDRTLDSGDRICLGFDGGKTDDATALVAIRVRDGLMVPLLLEEKPSGVDEWMVDVARVDSAVHRAFRDYDVVAFWADVHLWETQIQQWSEDYGARLLVPGHGGPIAWDMRQSRRVVAGLHEAFMSAILDGVVAHGPDPYGLGLEHAFKRHVMNTARVDSSGGVTFAKRGGRESKKKVDMYAAAMLAFGAYQEVRMNQALKPEKPTGGLSVGRY